MSLINHRRRSARWHGASQNVGQSAARRINAKQMSEDGIKFYLSNNGVWLTDFVK